MSSCTPQRGRTRRTDISVEPERWERINEILLEALEHAPRKRTAFLDQACDDDELRCEVESLLASDSEPELLERLEQPAFDLLERTAGDIGEATRVGPYRVVREIGRGGMGAVYLAVRPDDQNERRVAIKVLKRGDTAEISRRFRIERQILAHLEHPNIAKLCAGGTTADHRPYFVMEYVEGERIDDYCNARRLTLRQRLELFRKVCSAVQFAHQNLVVHRDLKPGNILVTAQGEPKLLDFGIAKLLHPANGLPMTDTATGQRLMTPEYASPEQVRSEPITTASDVYSLGVLLYELLTGHRPYRLKNRLREEVRRVICDEEPEKPSTAVSRVEEIRTGDGGTVRLTPEVVSRARGEEPRRLRRRLSGDLDNMVLMALRKEPQRRYASVEQLSEDLCHYLEGRPVRARKDTFAYRTSKLLRRRKKEVAAAVVAILFLAGVGLDRELQQRETACARDRAQRVSEFLIELFQVSDPSAAKGNSITAREILDRGAERIEQELREEPELQAALMNTMGKVYMSLGLYEAATPLLETALAQRRQVHGRQHPEIAESLSASAELLYAKGHYDAAEPLLREALAMQRELRGSDHPDVAAALKGLGVVLMRKGEYAMAESLLREALAIQRRLLGAEHPDVTATLNDLAAVLHQKGDYAAAEPMFREALATKRKQLGDEHPAVALALNNLAMVLYQEGDYEAAESLFRQSLAMARKLLGAEHPNVSRALTNLAMVLRARGEYEAAESLVSEALVIRRKQLGPDHPDVARGLTNLAELYQARGRYEAAEPLAREAVDTLRRKLPPGHWRIARSESVLGASLSARGRFEQAEALLIESYPVIRNHRGEWARETVDALGRIIALYEAWGKPDKAGEYRTLLPPVRTPGGTENRSQSGAPPV